MLCIKVVSVINIYVENERTKWNEKTNSNTKHFLSPYSPFLSFSRFLPSFNCFVWVSLLIFRFVSVCTVISSLLWRALCYIQNQHTQTHTQHGTVVVTLFCTLCTSLAAQYRIAHQKTQAHVSTPHPHIYINEIYIDIYVNDRHINAHAIYSFFVYLFRMNSNGWDLMDPSHELVLCWKDREPHTKHITFIVYMYTL